jgi:hypothetical protein
MKQELQYDLAYERGVWLAVEITKKAGVMKPHSPSTYRAVRDKSQRKLTSMATSVGDVGMGEEDKEEPVVRTNLKEERESSLLESELGSLETRYTRTANGSGEPVRVDDIYQYDSFSSKSPQQNFLVEVRPTRARAH